MTMIKPSPHWKSSTNINNDMAQNTIRQYLTTAFMLFLCSLSYAQEKFHVEEIFSVHGYSDGCTMVEINNSDIRGYHMDVFKSISYTKNGKEITSILLKDRPKAKKIREIIHEGKVQSGCYMMTPNKNGKNRFIVFAFSSEDSGAIIYIESKCSIDDILQICYNE